MYARFPIHVCSLFATVVIASAATAEVKVDATTSAFVQNTRSALVTPPVSIATHDPMAIGAGSTQLVEHANFEWGHSVPAAETHANGPCTAHAGCAHGGCSHGGCQHGHGCQHGCGSGCGLRGALRDHLDACGICTFTPFGAYTNGALQTQIANGVAVSLTLYHYDFHRADAAQAAELTYRGIYQLEKLAEKMQYTGFPIVIERTPGNEELDQQRRQHVLQQLADMSVAVTDEQVTIGRPKAFGMSGVEAEFIYQGQLEAVRTGGASALPAAGSSGSGSGSGVSSGFGG